MPHRFDLAVVGRPLGRSPHPLCGARDGLGAHVAGRARIADPVVAPPAVRSIGTGPRLYQGVSAGRPREWWSIHARGRLDRDGAGAARQRRRGRGILPHAESGQPWPHVSRCGALQDGAVRHGGRRLRAAAALGTRRVELVHRFGRLDVSCRPREHSRSAAPRRDVRRRPVHSLVVARVPDCVAVPRQPL